MSIGRSAGLGERPGARTAGAVGEQHIARPGKAKDRAGKLLDEIGMGRIAAKQVDVAAQPAAHGLEARDLVLQNAGALDQSRTRREAVRTVDRVVNEVCRNGQTAKQHQEGMPRPSCSPIMWVVTQHRTLTGLSSN